MTTAARQTELGDRRAITSPTASRLGGPSSPLACYVGRLHERHRQVDEGSVATYIPELGSADPGWFGIALAMLDGTVHAVGDAERPFTIQSISKPLTYALVLDDLGEDAVRACIGVEPSGDAFNAITLAPGTGRPLNPMVNAGAIAAASLVRPADGMDATARLLDGIGRFVGHPVEVDGAVLESERATGHRNRAIAHLLRASGAIDGDAMDAVERYFTQCSVTVNTKDLAMISATFANGGVNPATGIRAASAHTVQTVLTVMASCGMYDAAGEWLVDVGLPAKSGVAGGLLAVVPGRLGIGVFSPPLDAPGNSVRGVRVCRDLVADLGLHPLAASGVPVSPIRASYTLAEVGSRRRRSAAERAALALHGHRARIIELQGVLGFLAADAIADRLALPAADQDGVAARPPNEMLVLDLRHVERIEPSAPGLIADLIARSHIGGLDIVLSGGARHAATISAIGRSVAALGAIPLRTSNDLDTALEAAENELLGTDGSDAADAVLLADQAVARGLSAPEVAELEACLERRFVGTRETIVRTGDLATEIFLIERGRCSVVIDVEGGERRRLTTLGPGLSFGETALVGQQRRGADVVADTDVSCLVLTTSAFDRLSGRRPSIATTILRNLLESAIATAGRLTAELAVLGN